MKKFGCILTALLLCLSLSAHAEGLTLYTVSSFAGTDAAADSYVELLKTFEEESGCTIVDNSATSSEEWKASVLNDFAAGNEPDVMFFFAASADSVPLLSRVVSIAEINAAYPEAHLPESAALTEADGRVYAIPVRPYVEGLFVNTDLFARYDIPLPTTWALLENAILRFREEGITPIAISLTDIPHYLAELAILACSSPKDYLARPKTLEEVPASWYEGMALIRRLYELGAFPDNAAATTEAATSQLFRSKKAAMQLDGSWFANSIPAESMDTTMMLPMPAYTEASSPTAVIGGVSMGFYLTRRAWNDPAKRDAAVALLCHLASEDSLARLGGYQFSDRLAASYNELLSSATQMLPPIQDAMSKPAREVWLLTCVPAVAEGDLSPEDCWRSVLEEKPFE